MMNRQAIVRRPSRLSVSSAGTLLGNLCLHIYAVTDDPNWMAGAIHFTLLEMQCAKHY